MFFNSFSKSWMFFFRVKELEWILNFLHYILLKIILMFIPCYFYYSQPKLDVFVIQKNPAHYPQSWKFGRKNKTFTYSNFRLFKVNLYPLELRITRLVKVVISEMFKNPHTGFERNNGSPNRNSRASIISWLSFLLLPTAYTENRLANNQNYSV